MKKKRKRKGERRKNAHEEGIRKSRIEDRTRVHLCSSNESRYSHTGPFWPAVGNSYVSRIPPPRDLSVFRPALDYFRSCKLRILFYFYLENDFIFQNHSFHLEEIQFGKLLFIVNFILQTFSFSLRKS